MLRRLRGIARYRPRVLTFLVLLATATLLVLANLSYELGRHSAGIPPSRLTFEVGEPRGSDWLGIRRCGSMSYGWPLLWKQYVVLSGYGDVVVGWCYSAIRLAANVAMWLMMLAAPAAACEWVLRRYRLRLRWSLRTMLAAVALVGLFFGWFVWARDRANVEDAIIAEVRKRHGDVWLQRWGPKWLDLVGADRYRRRIVGALVQPAAFDDEDDNQALGALLRRLAGMPNFQYLYLHLGDLTPETAQMLGDFPQLRMLRIASRQVHSGAIRALAESLAAMRQLRVLSVTPGSAYEPSEFVDDEDDAPWEHDEAMCREYLAAIGNITQLECLHLFGMSIHCGELEHLAGLTNLRMLSLESIDDGDEPRNSMPMLFGLPALSRLEAIYVERHTSRDRKLTDDDLQYLTMLPRLKSLRLEVASGAALADLASIESLEDLSFSGAAVSAADLESLLSFKLLKKLHLPMDFKHPEPPDGTFEMLPHVDPDELDASLRILAALRKKNPGIVIDGDWMALTWNARSWLPDGCDTVDRLQTRMLDLTVRKWEEDGCPPYP